MASRGFNKLPPPGMKSDCWTGDLLTIVGLLGLTETEVEDNDVLLVVVEVLGTTEVVVDRLTSIFKGCSTVDLLVAEAALPLALPETELALPVVEGFSSVAEFAEAWLAWARLAARAWIILFFLLIDSTTSFIDILPD